MRKKEMCWANLVSCERVEKIANKSDKHRTGNLRDAPKIISFYYICYLLWKSNEGLTTETL